MLSASEVSRNLGYESLPHDYHSKCMFLHNFCHRFRHLPPQGSQEWLDGRRRTIGGSELSAVVGYGYNANSYRDTLASKLGLNDFNGNFYTEWGHLFEPVVQMWLGSLFDANVVETGTLPGCVKGTSYSPDGFAVVRRARINRLIDEGWIPPHEVPDDPMVLFEIKCPSTRIPSGTVPRHYWFQPASGLMHFPFVDIAYFVDVSIRCLTVPALREYLQGGSLHVSSIHRKTEPQAVAWGVLDVNTPLDMGEEDKMAFSGLRADYSRGCPMTDRTRMLDELSRHRYGSLAYVITNFAVTPMYRDPSVFSDTNLVQIREFLRYVDDGLAAPDKVEYMMDF